ncbi:amphoterin-induced protein 3 [Astyanax mexicanus]|uniref:amphoterin-induced protein 3 n=1 Tax=Astyanax mexicanus TaxID=7994 RepID=UPI0020CADD2D|nr:amphoterin-induced protein 3 [Astyanax mexicanus]
MRFHTSRMTSTLFLVLVFFWLGFLEANCPPGCLCPSDIVECGSLGMDRFPPVLPPTTSILDLSHNRLTWLAAGSFHGLSRLSFLRMSHNQISLLSPAAFHNASNLRHVDLSSNRLQVVARHHFQDLPGLEELLLYNNRITRVESNALMGLNNLRKVYLSLNQITDFPFFSIRKHSHPKLETLDLSSNRMSRLPLDDVVLLPVALQRGLFIHNNSLVCDCSTYRMFWHWDKEGYKAIRDFKDDYTCRMYGEPLTAIRFLRSPRFFDNCTIEKMISLISPKADMMVHEGEQVRLDCTGTLSSVVLSYSWVIPHQENLTLLIQNGSLRLNQDGSLEIIAVQSGDSGIYQCVAVDTVRMINESREVNLTVVPQRITDEPFSTGYTTLLGCAITLVVILMYLYLTPCRCGCCKPPPPSPTISGHGDDRCTLASIFGAPPSEELRLKGKSNPERHVVFLEPLMQDKNGHLTSAITPGQPTLLWDSPQMSRVKGCDEIM